MCENIKCVICYRELEDAYKFPEDFPDEWKMCCNCLWTGAPLLREGIEKTIEFYKIFFDCGTDRFLQHKEKAEKLIKLFTVVA